MNAITRTLNTSRLFVISFTVYLVIAAIYCSSASKADCFIHLNFIHTAELDAFFTFYTMLGDGLVIVVLVAILLLCRRYLQSIHVVAAFLASGLIAQVMKELTHAPRPRTFLQPGQYNHFIEGVTGGGWASFPSGHTTTAFAIATIMALHARNQWVAMLYLVLAISVGYSRIYLGQHFPQDVLAGSIIGVFFAACIYVIIPQLKLFGRRLTPEPAAHNFATLELP
jgi:membrane-associated phospholipid phosphatase